MPGKGFSLARFTAIGLRSKKAPENAVLQAPPRLPERYISRTELPKKAELFANDFAPDYSAETINKGADKMHMGFATGLFVISYFIQLLLCIKAENKHIRRIPLYLCVLGAVYSTMLYFEFFGLYHTGSWMQLEAYIYFIVLLIIGLALLLAKITHTIIRAVKNKIK